MNAAVERNLSPVKGLAATASAFAVVATVLLLITVIWAHGIKPCLEALRTMRTEPAPGPFWWIQVVGPQLILALPSFLFMDALGAMRRGLDAYAAGHFFTDAPGRALARAGDTAVAAIVAHVVVSPTVYSWVVGESRGIRLDYDIAYIGVFAFAICVSCVGRVLVSAAAIKAENDQIV